MPENDSDNFIINYFYVSKFFLLRTSCAVLSLMFDVWPIRLVYLNACRLIQLRVNGAFIRRVDFFYSTVVISETLEMQATIVEAAVKSHSCIRSTDFVAK